MPRRPGSQKGYVGRDKHGIYILYRDPTGKQRRKRGFVDEPAAHAELRRTLDEMYRGTYVQPSSLMFAEFAKQWLDSRVSITGSTFSAYSSNINKHLIPALGRLKLAEIRLDEVQRFASALSGKVSTKTLHNCMTLLHTMLAGKRNSALVRGLLRHDPTVGVELPTKRTKQIVPPTPEEVWTLLDIAKDHGDPAHDSIYLDAFTGLRRNELLALKYTDIDWQTKEVKVNKAIKLERIRGPKKWTWALGPTKSQRSNRRVALTESVMKILKARREETLDPNGWIFPSKNGDRWIDPDNFDRRIFGPVAEAAKLDLRFHDLRHFFASMLIAQGADPKYICDQMGHSSIQVTFDIYGHLFPQRKEEEARKLDAAFMAARKKAPKGRVQKLEAHAARHRPRLGMVKRASNR